MGPVAPKLNPNVSHQMMVVMASTHTKLRCSEVILPPDFYTITVEVIIRYATTIEVVITAA
jgi:hypothetical protein